MNIYTEDEIDFSLDLSTPIKTLETLAEDKDHLVRSSAARNRNTPIKTLEKLAKDETDYVRSSVAKNPNIPMNALKKLAYDKNWGVRKFVLENANVNSEIREIVKNTNALYKYLI